MLKVGDKVVGTSHNYYVTNKGWLGTVVEVCDRSRIVVTGLDEQAGHYGKNFTVDSRNFKLFEREFEDKPTISLKKGDEVKYIGDPSCQWRPKNLREVGVIVREDDGSYEVQWVSTCWWHSERDLRILTPKKVIEKFITDSLYN